MNERIINLLKLCMDAQEKGNHVLFDFGTGLVSVYHFVRENGETTDISYNKSIFLKLENTASQEFDEAENYLNKLIGSDERIC